MGAFYVGEKSKVGDGAREFDDAVVGAGREVKAGGRGLKMRF